MYPDLGMRFALKPSIEETDSCRRRFPSIPRDWVRHFPRILPFFFFFSLSLGTRIIIVEHTIYGGHRLSYPIKISTDPGRFCII